MIRVTARAWLLACLTGGMFALPAATPAQPTSQPSASAPSDASTPRVRRRRVLRPAVPPGSSETTRERERRLARECKGRPNAGACLGFGG